MYLRHYGLRSKPFQLAHDPAFYYAAAHQIPLNELCYSIEERQGLATLVGAPGNGKTTLLKRLLQSFGPHQRGVFMSETSIEGVKVLRRLATALGLTSLGDDKALPDFLWKLLARETQAGRTVVLLIDEAQGLSVQQFEELRYLTNLESSGRKLVEIILAGQPTLEKKLAAPSVVAVKQRVAVRCQLEPLDLDHTAAYIEHRLQVAGVSKRGLFAPEALSLVHEKSGGVPRLINIISERCLLVGYVDGAEVIDRARAEEAVTDLQIPPAHETHEPEEPSALGTGGEARLLMRMGSRVDVIEQKLDLLLQMLVRNRVIRPELADDPRKHRWLESLGRTDRAAPVSRDPQQTTELRIKKAPGSGPSGGGQG